MPSVPSPSASFRFQSRDAMRVIGALENLRKLHRWLGVDQGR